MAKCSRASAGTSTRWWAKNINSKPIKGTNTMKQYGTILDAIIAIAVFAGIGILLALGV
jgi:hypothetical protein